MKPIDTLKALKDLEAQRARAQTIVEQSASEITALQTEIVEATARMHEVQAAYIRGLANEKDVMAARTAMESSRERLKEKQQVSEAARDVQPKIDQEVYAATHAHNAALRARSEELIAPIRARIAGDKKIRAALVEIFGLTANSNMTPFCVDWEGMVSDCFPDITSEEAAAAMAAGKTAILS
ncbi:hypothetical protein [Zoogloea sp.]|uniref:hypothetical protein n=1 Tax=Zoogloea sp. TaxID=49181 RepID=UPI0035ADFE1F